MIDMDRQKAFAVLGLPDDASREEIDALVGERRRRLRQRIVFASTAEQRHSSERALAELENAHAVATLLPDDTENNFPQGAKLTLPAGTTLADRYVIRRRIGYGENGAVFAALDLSWGNEVALKIIRPELLLVPGTYDRLSAANRSVFELAHKGIAKNYGLSKLDRHVAIAMELLPQRNLRSLLNDVPKGPPGVRPAGLPVGQVVDTLQRLCSALDYARCKTLHLNLKPDNVLLSEDGNIKITDFGLAEILQPTLTIASPTAREQRRYRAPELARLSETGSSGSTSVDQRADQFSVAAIAHFLLLAAAPYPDPSVSALTHMGLRAPMADVLAKALSSDPVDRYPSLKEFVGAFERAARVGASRRVLVSILGAVGVAAILLATTSFVFDESPQFRKIAAPFLSSHSGSDSRATITQDVRVLQDGVISLSQDLNELQSTLRRSVIEHRISVRAAAQALELSETVDQRLVAQQELDETTLAYEKVVALQDIANPDIFNNPETLNALNMIGLANEHVVNGRSEAAKATLLRAEAVLKAKVVDYRQAEALAIERFGALPSDAPTSVDPGQLRREWQEASQNRKRFATEVQARMLEIPGGSFQMGDETGIGNQTERPVRRVLVPAFQISRFEVTVSEYEACVSEQACSVPDGLPLEQRQPNAPISGVSWFDAQDYVGWLSRKTGQDYRLPTEAEWEYAARANNSAAYPWGEEAGLGLANCIHCGSAWENIGPAPVGSFAPNAFGLYDMSGNVWEWTADCWYADYTGAPGIAIAREGNALCTERVLRGGSWDNDAWLARTTYRGRGRADMQHDLYGFRLAKSVN